MSEVIRIDLGGVNSYLLRGPESGADSRSTPWALVDTGGHLATDPAYTDRRDQLLHHLEAAGCHPGNLILIVLTHGHNDHTANAAYLRERFGAPIAMHPNDRSLVEQPTLENWLQAHRYREPELLRMYAQYADAITAVTQRALSDFTPFTPDILLEDGSDLSAFGIDARVIHVPGHTSGSVAILTSTGGLIAGDTYANLGQPSLAPNADDFDRMTTSAGLLSAYPVRAVYPGHGEPFPGPPAL